MNVKNLYITLVVVAVTGMTFSVYYYTKKEAEKARAELSQLANQGKDAVSTVLGPTFNLFNALQKLYEQNQAQKKETSK